MDSLATGVQGFVTLLARLMLVAIFMLSTMGNKIPQFSETVEYMASKGVPQPKLALFGAIALLLMGGLSVIPGAWTRIGASFLFVFLAAATFFFHDFWSYADPALAAQQQGQLILVGFGPGPWSVDGWIAAKEAEAAGAPSRPRRSVSKDKSKDASAE
jgi:putative oxidoreductase